MSFAKTTFATMAVLAASAAADTVLLGPDASCTGSDVAIVWIHGASCPEADYTTIAETVQSVGATNGMCVYIGIPHFASGSPDPVTIKSKFTNTLSSLQDMGFTGDAIAIAGHSLGGVMAQNYSESNTDIKAQVLMGATLTRNKHSINDDGTTNWDYTVPTLTIGGTKDGLMRITRVAENYWHGSVNVEDAQSEMFKTITLDGVSHWGFASGDPPSTVRNKDLRLDVTEEEAHTMVADAMIDWLGVKLLGKTSTYDMTATLAIVDPIVEAMELEGYYNMKDPCYDYDLINTDSPTCLTGAPWHEQITEATMGGDFSNPLISVVNDDNFHEVQDTDPIHLPEIDTTCDPSTTVACTINTITVSQNIYNALDTADTGYYPIAATEMKTKLTSRQNIQESAGNDVEFSVSDETGNRCADINDKSIAWAYGQLSATQKNLYDTYGMTMMTGDDMGPYNAGPLWIWTLMSYTLDTDARTYTVQAPMMRTPTSYPIKSASGFHYCKVLSPFAALEWMLVDGIHDLDGIQNDSVSVEQLE